LQAVKPPTSQPAQAGDFTYCHVLLLPGLFGPADFYPEPLVGGIVSAVRQTDSSVKIQAPAC
jgi:hypothetical protein